jgi:hypothetical protein
LKWSHHGPSGHPTQVALKNPKNVWYQVTLKRKQVCCSLRELPNTGSCSSGLFRSGLNKHHLPPDRTHKHWQYCWI